MAEHNVIIDGRDLDDLTACIRKMLELGPVAVQMKAHNRRSLSQNRLAQMWYTEISRWLRSEGREFATPEWCKSAMKHTFLGYQDTEQVDVVTGVRTTKQELRHTSKLDTGEMKLYLDLVYAWALEKGLLLTIPDGCEYHKLTKLEVA